MSLVAEEAATAFRAVLPRPLLAAKTHERGEAAAEWHKTVFITTLLQFSKLLACSLNHGVIHALATFLSRVIPSLHRTLLRSLSAYTEVTAEYYIALRLTSIASNCAYFA